MKPIFSVKATIELSSTCPLPENSLYVDSNTYISTVSWANFGIGDNFDNSTSTYIIPPGYLIY